MLKDQLVTDMDQVFMNPSEFADTVMIDGIEASGFFNMNKGEYEEGIPTLILSASQLISSNSVVIAIGKTYGVLDIVPNRTGGLKVTLGNKL